MRAFKHKRPTIIAIAAHPKMEPGEVWYEAEAGPEYPLILLTRPYWKSWGSVPTVGSGGWWIDVDNGSYKRTISLGDSGVLGCAYDGRPQTLIKDPAKCLGVVHEYEDWLINTDDGSRDYMEY